jgi:flagellar biogenesis protein FliO
VILGMFDFGVLGLLAVLALVGLVVWLLARRVQGSGGVTRPE